MGKYFDDFQKDYERRMADGWDVEKSRRDQRWADWLRALDAKFDREIIKLDIAIINFKRKRSLVPVHGAHFLKHTFFLEFFVSRNADINPRDKVAILT